MSLEKYDKLCERMITAEPASQKDILDERQKIIQQNAAVNALALYSAAVTLNVMIMEIGAMWCESIFSATILFVPIAYIYLLIYCARKDALVGVNGSPQLKFSACNFIGFGAVVAAVRLLRYSEDKGFAVVRNGMLSEDFVIVLYLALIVIAGAAALVLIRKNNREKKD